jgi:glycerophosphoryl diester phosphodiesterase
VRQGLGLTDVHLNAAHARRDPDVVARLHMLGMLVAVGIIDDPIEARRVSRLGADMMCTDDPIGLTRDTVDIVGIAEPHRGA